MMTIYLHYTTVAIHHTTSWEKLNKLTRFLTDFKFTFGHDVSEILILSFRR